jgi:hypothetical protein
MESSSVFKYPTLSTAATNSLPRIRLLTIHPGAFEEDIQIDLETVELDLADPIYYEALSYTWGSMEHPDIIYIGPTKAYTLQVSRNLAVALRYLRNDSKSRRMWIDAVCIDQSNVSERSHQVAHMGDIYRLAFRVNVWLGPSGDDSDYAIDLLGEVGSKVDFDPQTRNMITTEAAQEDDFWTDPSQPLDYGERELLAILKLFERPWFNRLWIRQEIYLGQTKAVVQAGNTKIPWSILSTAAMGIWKKGRNRNSVTHVALDKRLGSLSDLLASATTYIARLRTMYGTCLCTDPRDRIYAVINMLPDEEKDIIGPPDYSLSSLDVWKKTTLAYIHHLQNIGLDYYVLSFLTECFGREPFDNPSWIPKWEVDMESEPSRTIEYFGAVGGPFKPKIQYLQGDILRILGVAIQVVQHVQQPSRSTSPVTTVKRFLEKFDINQEYPDGRSAIEACASVFTGGHLYESRIPHWGDRLTLSETIRGIELIISNGENDVENWASRHLDNSFDTVISGNMEGKSIITTEEGYFGLAPWHVHQKDIIVAFAGGQTPMVLRPSNSITPQYHLIGPCMVEGFMANEAFLGPLPSQHRLVSRQLPDDPFIYAEIYDDNNKSFVFGDPRIESLPLDLEEWRECEVKRMPFAFDIDIDAFRNMDISAEYFDII